MANDVFTIGALEIAGRITLFPMAAPPPVSAAGTAVLYLDTSRHQVLKSENGGSYIPLGGGTVRTMNANGAALSSDSVILATGTVTITLPDATAFRELRLTIKNVGTGVVTVSPPTVTPAQTIDGSNAYVISQQYYAITVVSDGTNWYII